MNRTKFQVALEEAVNLVVAPISLALAFKSIICSAVAPLMDLTWLMVASKEE